MAGGKKKNLANRLAKMSDEERARYMQRKADIEEEAKKRKEQLISTFLKNKIKKEDGFSRLNLAKINQQWHQIMRFNKSKEMKQDVEHMKNYIDRVLDYKNRTIEKLLEEIEMAEEQYAHNFQSHMIHIDKIIDSHNKHLNLMNEEFEQDLKELLDVGSKERASLSENAKLEQMHLKSIIFGQNKNFQLVQKQDHEKYLQKREDVTSSFRIKFEAFIKRRESLNAAIWQRIADVVGGYVTQTDVRRLHLAELRRIDAESAAEIANNQERINRQEQEIVSLTEEFEEMQQKRQEQIIKLEHQLKKDTADFFTSRKDFRKAVELDERHLVVLTQASANAIENLTRLLKKGSQITNLMETCKKLETEKEHVIKWLPLAQKHEDTEEQQRPKSEKVEENVKKIVINSKASISSTSSSGSLSGPSEIIQREFGCMMDLEQFWDRFSRVDVEKRMLKKEKRFLEDQNKHIRGMLRAVLEKAVLMKSEINSCVSTRVASKRGARSAPLKRILV